MPNDRHRRAIRPEPALAAIDAARNDPGTWVETDMAELERRLESYRYLRLELTTLLRLPLPTDDQTIVRAVRALARPPVAGRFSILPHDDAIYTRIENLEAEQQRLVRVLREAGLIT